MTGKRTTQKGLAWILLSVAAACSGDDASEPRPSTRTALPAGHVDLLRAPFAVDLPTQLDLPPQPPERWIVTDIQEVRQGSLLWYEAPLPFPAAGLQERFATEGLAVTADGVPVPWSAYGETWTRGPAWRISEGRILLRLEREPEQLEVVHPLLRERWSRLQPETSGLTAAEYVRDELTLNEQTRPGLFLPAGAEVRWRVELPEEARFTFAAALVEDLFGFSGELDRLSVELFVDEQRVFEHPLSIADDGAFALHSVDLASFAGRSAELAVRSHAGLRAFLGSPLLVGRSASPPRRVVWVGLDTTRPDHFGLHGYERDTTPELDRWGAEAVVFDRAWAPAPHTRPSFRSALTGRWPVSAVCSENVAERFARAGFVAAGFVANVHLHRRFGFHRGFGLWWLEKKATAAEQVDRALDWLGDHRDEDTFVFLHLMDPHLPYTPPAETRGRFTGTLKSRRPVELPEVFNRWEVARWEKEGALAARHKALIQALHDEELAYTSRQLARFLDAVAELPGETAIVLHSDHGEEFWEHGGFEHNHTLYDETTRALLWIRPPGGVEDGPVRVAAPVSIADIGPTMLALFGLDQSGYDGIDLAPLWRGEEPAARALPLGFLTYDREEWGVILDGHKFTHRTADGVERLFDLERDPEERTDLAAARDLSPFRAALASVHPVRTGAGARIHVRGSEPVLFRLETPVRAVGVFDPESLSRHPVNEAWGEIPPVAIADVGSVTTLDAGRAFRFDPGPAGDALLYALFASDSERALTSDAPERVTIHPGFVVAPTDDEAARMATCATSTGIEAATSDDMELLRSLGYVGEDD